jgi:hypothetical protein
VQAQTPAAPAAPAAAPAAAQQAPGTPSPAPASDRRFDDPSALTMGTERDAAIANMESMGFARADIDAAMRAAFFNPDRAVEYLLTVGLYDHPSILNSMLTDVRVSPRVPSRSNKLRHVVRLLLLRPPVATLPLRPPPLRPLAATNP